MTNPFLDYGDEVTSGLKRKQRIAGSRREKAREKEQDDAARMFMLWQQWHNERKKELMECGGAVVAFIEWLENMTIEDGDELLARYSTLGDLDCDMRHEVLSLIDRRCILLRERHGFVPFDDSLDDPPETVFLQIREMI